MQLIPEQTVGSAPSSVTIVVPHPSNGQRMLPGAEPARHAVLQVPLNEPPGASAFEAKHTEALLYVPASKRCVQGRWFTSSSRKTTPALREALVEI